MTSTEPRSRERFEEWYAQGSPTHWDAWQAATAAQSAELRRLRISQLRRMASACGGIEERMLTKASRQGLTIAYYRRCIWVRERGNRFSRACRAEIERLRGDG